MALQFNPPQDLINSYMNRPSPGEQASNSISQALQSYIQMKTQQQQMASLEAARKAAEFKAVADYVPEDQIAGLAKNYGINIPTAGAVPPTPSTGTVPSPQANPMAVTPVEQGAQQSMMDQHPGGVPDAASGVSPLVQAHAAATGHNPLGIPVPTSKAGLAKYKTNLETQKLVKDLEKPDKGPLDTVTKEQALASGKFDPTKQVVMEPPAPRLDLGTKQDQFDQKEWDKIVKDTNPLTASSRSTLGMASKANFQADRALVTLSKPVVTNQEAGNVMADIAAIYQTGSPTQYGMSHQEYSTLYGKIQGALQTVTGKPQDALPDAIKQRLVGVLHDMKGTNSGVLKQQLDFTEKSKAKIIKKFPDEWKGIRATLEGGQDGGAAIPESGPHGPSVTQNGHTYNWNAKTGQYE